VADDASIGFDPHNHAVEDRDGFSTAPIVSGFVKGKFDAIAEDSGNFHEWEKGREY
jgi:hypothetical protein